MFKMFSVTLTISVLVSSVFCRSKVMSHNFVSDDLNGHRENVAVWVGRSNIAMI